MSKRKARKKKKQQFDIGRGLLPVLLSIITLTFTVFALVLESGLLWAVTGLSTVATAAAIKAAQKKAANDKKRKQQLPKTPPKTPTRLRTKPAQEPAEESVSSGGVKCTNTGKPIEGDGRCTCATRHVATQAGVKTFGGPIGRPIGKKAKEPRVPTTSRAKPVPAGDAMQKD